MLSRARRTCAHIAALGVCAAAIAQTPRQSSQPALDSRDPAAQTAAPIDSQTQAVYFADDFRMTELDAQQWPTRIGARIATSNAPRIDAPVLRLSAADRMVRLADLRSRWIDLSAAPDAELWCTVGYRELPPDSDLIIEFWTGLRWEKLDIIRSGQARVAAAASRVIVLPPEAFHQDFRLRFRAMLPDTIGSWELLGVAVTEANRHAVHAVSVDVDPPREALIRVVSDERWSVYAQATPFTRWLPADSQATLLAPAQVEGWTFSHWTTNGVGHPEQGRVLALDVTRNTEAAAHYRPYAAHAKSAVIHFGSTPIPGPPIEVRLDPSIVAEADAGGQDVRFLVGESLVIRTPQQTARVIFLGWTVNGTPAAHGEGMLRHRVVGDAEIIAEYMLLGDMNGDDALDKLDVDLFVLALVTPLQYTAQFPEIDRVRVGDVNQDGTFDQLDVERFVDLLVAD